MHHLHLLNAHLAGLYKILSDSVSSELTVEFLQLHLVPVLNAHLAELLQNSQLSSVCNCVFSHTALPPRYSATLRSSLSC